MANRTASTHSVTTSSETPKEEGRYGRLHAIVFFSVALPLHAYSQSIVQAWKDTLIHVCMRSRWLCSGDTDV